MVVNSLKTRRVGPPRGGFAVREKLLFGSILAAVPFVTAVAVSQPTLAIIGAVAPALFVLASRSIAYPVALGGVPTLVIALLNHNPFPHGLVTIAFFGWTALAVLLALLGGTGRLPLSLLATGAVLASLLLAIELLARLPDSLDPSYGSTKLQLFVLQNLLALVAGVLIAQRRDHFDRYVGISIFIAGASALLLLWRLAGGQAQALYDSRFTISADENPILLGRQAAEGLLFVGYVLLGSGRIRGRTAATLIAPALLVALLAAGSRGPILGAIVGVVTLSAVLARSKEVRRRLVGFAIVGMGGVVLPACTWSPGPAAPVCRPPARRPAAPSCRWCTGSRCR